MRIKKTFQTAVPTGKVLNNYTESNVDTYSCDYVNELETYSTDETRIGTWIDGKPIYRKVIQIPSFSTTVITVNTGLTNISNVTDFKGSFKRLDSGTSYFYSIDNVLLDECTLNYNTGEIKIKTNNQYVTFSGYITLEYTKTTD